MQKYVYWDENIYQILSISTIDMIFDQLHLINALKREIDLVL